jgi:hypothetical protein
MAFIAGKGFAILNSKAEKGDAKAKELLSKLDSIEQDEADRLFSEILGKKGGGSKSKKTKAPGASATDGQGEITEGPGEQAPTGKATPKAKGEAKIAAPDAPTGEVKPKGKDYQLEIDDLSDKLSEVRQGRMDGDVDEIRARIKELKGKKKVQGKAEPTGKVEPKAKKQKDLIAQYDDRGLDFLDELGDDFDPETKRRVANEYLQELQEKGQGFEGDTFDRENVYDRLLKTGNKTENTNKQKPADPLGADAFNAGYNDMLQQLASSYGQKKKTTEAPAGKVTPKTEAADPLDVQNLETLFTKYKGNEDKVLDDLRSQLAGAESDPENPLSNGDLQGIVEAFAIKRGSTQPVLPGKNKQAAPAAESNVPSQFKDEKDAAKFSVFMSVKDAIDDDLDFDENEIKEIANEYGLTKDEVSQIIRGYQKRKQGGTEIDTAGANVQPAGATGDIEPETQQLAGIGPIEKLQYRYPENAQGFKDRVSAIIEREGNEKPLGEEDINVLAQRYGLTEDEVDKAMREIGAKEASAKNQNAEPRKKIDDIMQSGRGGVSEQEADAIAAEFGISKDEVRKLERQSQSEIAFPAPDGEAIAADQDFDEQGNPLGNALETNLDPIEQEVDRRMNEYDARAQEIIDGIEQFTSGGRFELSDDDWNDYYYEMQRMSTSSPVAEKWLRNNSPKGNANDQEVADELGVDQEQLGGLLGPNPTYNKRTAPWEPENIQEILAQTGGDKAKALELLKQQQSQYKGPRLENKFLPGLIDQVAAGEKNPSLPASEPTAEQLAETDVLFENTAETPAAEPARIENNFNASLTNTSGQSTQLESIAYNVAQRGNNEREKAINEVISKAPATAQGLADALNNSGIGDKSWKPVSERDNQFVIESIDGFGNKNRLQINKQNIPQQAPAQIKQTAQANAQAAGIQPAAKPAQAPAANPQAAGTPDRKKVEAAAVELGINADLLQGLLELIKRIK